MKVVIVGAGVAGLALGWRLSQQRIETLVFERAQPGCGATWASAGIIAAPAADRDDASGEAKLANWGARLWPAFAAEIETASNRAVGFRVDGALVVARTPAESDQLHDQAANGAGEFLLPDAARAREPRLAPDMWAALWSANQGRVNNRALGKALAAAFVKAGGRLYLNEAVVRFEFRGERLAGVRTPFALHEADAYVIAAGAWSARIEGLPSELVPPVVPVKGEMLALTPPSGDHLPEPAIGGDEIYLVPQRDQLLVGATVERVGFDSSPTGKASAWLRSKAVALMPCLAKWPIAEHWAGLRPGSPDDLPILGRTALPELFVASGQYRNGILYAPAVAEALNAMITGKKAPEYFSAFDPCRFAANPFHPDEYAE